MDKTTGSLITWARKKKGLSQNALAKLCGISRMSIVRYESGERTPDLETLNTIANALEAPLVALWLEWHDYDDLDDDTLSQLARYDNDGTKRLVKDMTLQKQIDRNNAIFGGLNDYGKETWLDIGEGFLLNPKMRKE